MPDRTNRRQPAAQPGICIPDGLDARVSEQGRDAGQSASRRRACQAIAQIPSDQRRSPIPYARLDKATVISTQQRHGFQQLRANGRDTQQAGSDFEERGEQHGFDPGQVASDRFGAAGHVGINTVAGAELQARAGKRTTRRDCRPPSRRCSIASPKSRSLSSSSSATGIAGFEHRQQLRQRFPRSSGDVVKAGPRATSRAERADATLPKERPLLSASRLQGQGERSRSTSPKIRTTWRCSCATPNNDGGDSASALSDVRSRTRAPGTQTQPGVL